jgi:hypothetical protein
VTDAREGTVPAPEQFCATLVDAMPPLLDDIRAYFARDEPDYAALLDVERAEVELGSAAAMQQLTRLTAQVLAGEGLCVRSDTDVQDLLFEEIGRSHWRQGRDLSTLLATYQTCARLAWRRLSQAMLVESHPPQTLAALAEALFFFIDQLSSASARGYLAEQSESAITRERLRAELVELLLSGRSDTTAVQAAAARAGWRLPREAALIVVEPGNELGRAILDRLDATCLPVRRHRLLGAIVPDPVTGGQRDRLSRLLRGSRAVVGHTVPLEHLPASAVIAEIAARLQRTGVLTDDPVFVDEHLDAIIVHRDIRLLDALRRQALAPLADAQRGSRDRLAETLSAWLRHMGDRQAVARELHVHPQTVRYRMGQLHELFGGDLDDPAARARLMLALAWNAPAQPG